MGAVERGKPDFFGQAATSTFSEASQRIRELQVQTQELRLSSLQLILRAIDEGKAGEEVIFGSLEPGQTVALSEKRLSVRVESFTFMTGFFHTDNVTTSSIVHKRVENLPIFVHDRNQDVTLVINGEQPVFVPGKPENKKIGYQWAVPATIGDLLAIKCLVRDCLELDKQADL